MAVVKKKDGRWFCVYYDERGKQVWKSFGRGAEAQKAAKVFDLEIKLKKKKGCPVSEKGNIDITHLAQEYLNVKEEHLHRHTLNSIVFMINEIAAPIMGGKPITSLTKKGDLLLFIRKIKERGVSQATLNRYLAYLNAILNWGVRNDFIPFNPFKGYKKEKEPPYKIPIITVEEMERILKAAPEHLRWALTVEFYTGCRPGQSELFALKWDDIDWEERTITVYGSKTGKIRKVCLNDVFYELLKKRFEERDSDYLISYRGRPVKSLKKSWATALQKAGIKKKLRLYDIRHAFATYLLAHGADLKAVSEMMGHHSTKMTADRYYQLVKDLKKDAVQKLPALKIPEVEADKNSDNS